MLSTRLDETGQRARECGLSRAGFQHLQSLVSERTRNSWAVGDALVAAYGMPCPSGAGDGSYEKFTVLADTVGVSRSFLTSCRANAAAWPAKERKSVAWAVHRLLAARPDRFVLLGDFIDHCNRQRITPSHAALRIWLDALSEAPTPLGRPRVDPVSRCERMALALETDALARLVQRLEDVLRSRQLTSVA